MSAQDPALKSYLESNFPYQLCVVSAAALVVYDCFLTFDAEFSIFWRRRWNVSSVLYFVNRYVEIMSCISAAILVFPVQDQICANLPILEEVSTMLPYLSWAVFSAFRAYALTDCNRCLAIVVFILIASFLVPNIYESAGFDNVNLPAPYNCSRAFPPGAVFQPLLSATRAVNILGEAILVGITIAKTYGWLSASRNLARRRSVAEVLLTNGVLCFSIPLVLNALTLALTLVGYDNQEGAALLIGQCIVAFRDVITSILISRFLLDLGAFRDDILASDAFSSNYHSSRLSFAVSIFQDTLGDVGQDEDGEALERQGR